MGKGEVAQPSRIKYVAHYLICDLCRFCGGYVLQATCVLMTLPLGYNGDRPPGVETVL
jgi:hypothetical protein